MSALIDIAENYLIDIGWKYEKDDDHGVIKTGVNATNASYRLIVYAIEDKDLLTVYVSQDNNIPDNLRAAVAEFIARANFGLNLGNFDLDMDSGELGYKVAIDVEGGVLSTDMIGNMVGAAVATMDKYYPGLMSVLFANVAPQDAIMQIERPPVTH
jgi:hypothetical protein